MSNRKELRLDEFLDAFGGVIVPFPNISEGGFLCGEAFVGGGAFIPEDIVVGVRVEGRVEINQIGYTAGGFEELDVVRVPLF